MRIALTHPYTWPHVRRGGERLASDLTRWLVAAGHDVATISAVPGPGRRTRTGRLTQIEHRGIDARVLRRFDVDQPVTYLLPAAMSARRWRPDVLHGMSYLDGTTAGIAGRPPFVLHLQGMPVRRSLQHRPVHRRLFARSLRAADAVVTVSRAAAAAARAEFGIDARPVHNGVFVHEFATAAGRVDRSPVPTVLFPGAADDPRKRLPLLVEAVEALRPAWPDLELDVADATPEQMPDLYARAWVTCLPAVREAFGLVFVESLATGTPAVGVRDGGVPEVLGEPDWLAEPDDAGSLVAALDRALRAAEDPGIGDRCRELAAPFDWSVRGPEFVELYDELVRRRAGPP